MSRRKLGRFLLLGAIGILASLFATSIAFGMARGGDGWDGPFYLSLSLFILYPCAVFSAFIPAWGSERISVGLLWTGAAFDLLVLLDLLGEHDQFMWVCKYRPGVEFFMGCSVVWMASFDNRAISPTEIGCLNQRHATL